MQIGRDLNISYKSSFVLLHKLREAMAREVWSHQIGGPDKVVEIDGCYVGATVRKENKAADRKDRRENLGPEANSFTIGHRELLEMIIKQSNVHEGRWVLTANFGVAPGNFGPAPEQVVPGLAVALNNVGMALADPSIPEGMTMDAAVVNPAPRAEG